jgi:hypothetical protein
MTTAKKTATTKTAKKKTATPDLENTEALEPEPVETLDEVLELTELDPEEPEEFEEPEDPEEFEDLEDLEEPEDPEEPEPKLCIRVKAAHKGNHVALADRPGGSFATVAKDGDVVEVLAVEGDWYKVAGGYLHKSKTETVQPI